MTEHQMAEQIAELERRLAGVLEMVKNLPPTLPQALELHAKWLRKEPDGVQLRISGAVLDSAIIEESSLKGVAFRFVNLDSSRFLMSKLGRATFKKSDLSYSSFTDCELEYADFHHSNVSKSIFTEREFELQNVKKDTTAPDASVEVREVPHE